MHIARLAHVVIGFTVRKVDRMKIPVLKAGETVKDSGGPPDQQVSTGVDTDEEGE